MAKKSIAIIGVGETEWFYFDALRRARRFPFKVAPDFPLHADLPHMLKLAERYQSEVYDYVVCLIDMDRLKKTKRFFRQHDIYRTLLETGNLQQAMSNAESLCTLKEEHPDYVVEYSQMHEVFQLLESMV